MAGATREHRELALKAHAWNPGPLTDAWADVGGDSIEFDGSVYSFCEENAAAQAIADAEARGRAAAEAAANVCEVCGDCLMLEPPRCERHAHTEPGDPEWTHDLRRDTVDALIAAEARGRAAERADVVAWARVRRGGQHTNGRTSSAWEHVRDWVAAAIERGEHDGAAK